MLPFLRVVSCRDIQQLSPRTKKTIWAEPKLITANQARSWMREAEALGKGVTKGTGIHLEFCAMQQSDPTKNVGLCSDLLDNLSTSETHTSKGVQNFVDFVGSQRKKINDDQKNSSSENIEKIAEDPTKSTKPCNPLPVQDLPVDNSSHKNLQNLQNDFVPTIVETGCRVLIHARGMSNDNRTGVVSQIRKLRDGRNELCTREDGSVRKYLLFP